MNYKSEDKFAAFKKILTDNFTAIVSFISIFIGIFTGACVYSFSDSFFKNEIMVAFLSFNTNFNDKTNIEIFSGMLISGLIYFFVMFVLGSNIFGKELSPVVTLFKTTGLGAIIAYLYQQFGAEGFEYALLVFIPGKMLFIFAALLITKLCFETSISLRSGLSKEDIAVLIKIYSIKSLFCLAVMIASWSVDFICLKAFSGLINFTL